MAVSRERTLSTEVASIVGQTVERVCRRDPSDVRQAVLGVCEDIHRRASPAWRRWPASRETADVALQAIRAWVVTPDSPVSELLLARLEVLEPEDDGSSAWAWMLESYATSTPVLGRERDPARTFESVVLAYLDTLFATTANEVSSRLGRPISEGEAQQLVPNEERWNRGVGFVDAL
jgi:hypothetical protein